jgi:hypothetical protein
MAPRREHAPVDYEALAAHFLKPPAVPIAQPAVPDTAARRLRDALEPIATVGWWSRSAAEAMAALGHGFFDGYVWGRAASMGAGVAPGVVVAAFGVFEAAMLGAVLEHGRTISTAPAVLAAREAGAGAGLAACLDASAEAALDAFAAPLLEACAGLDATARPLFSALRGLPVPTTAAGRAWRAAEMVREHRGDGHLAACAATGLDAVEMNVLTEVWLDYPVGAYSASRGFPFERIDAAVRTLAARGWLSPDATLTTLGRQARQAIEAATDRSQEALVAALGERLESIIDAATTVSGAVLAAQAAPSDPRKRAAG